MPPSYRKIDYRLRPAKHVERALFAEAFKRMPFYSIEAYQYVGMGSLHFADVRLFHKALGISSLISIENKIGDKDRFEYNKPFSCLETKYGNTWDILPKKIDWTKPSLIWLDYDGKLDGDNLSDIKTVTSHAKVGSFFAISVNSSALHYPSSRGTEEKTALDKLQDAVGKERIPTGTKSVDLADKGTALAYYKIILAEIQSSLSVRNQGVEQKDKVKFKQIFHLRYADGAPMLTVGGFFLKPSFTRKFNQAEYSKQPYFRAGEQSLSIDVPLLTFKEIMALEEIAPETDLENIDPNTFVHNTKAPNTEVINYLKTYRFLPNYVSVET